MIDFSSIAQTALINATTLLIEWYPDGKIIDGEFRIGDVRGSSGKSLAVNLSSGLWNDRAGTDKGGDLISLYAARQGISQSDAAHAVATRLGIQSGNGSATRAAIIPNPAPSPTTPPTDPWQPLPEADQVFPPAEHPSRGKPTLVHTYRTIAGKISSYVYRFDGSDGKTFAPLTWCRHPDGREAWRWKAPSCPRPLYNLQTLTRCAAPVLVVEGEKTADAAAALLPDYVVITWPGGASTPKHSDWSPLHGRNVAIWPDADTPGRHAAELIAGQLPDAVILRVPDGWSNGYDLADAARDGWTTLRLTTHIACEHQRLATEYESARRSPPPPDPEPDTAIVAPEPNQSNVFADAPFRILGYDRGDYNYLPSGSLQITTLTAATHSKQNLIVLAPRSYWDSTFATEKSGTDWHGAANALIQSSHAAGLFNRDQIRGRGCWIDDGRVVWHGGDRILCNGSTHPIQGFQSKFIYELAPAFQLELVPPASNSEASRLLDLCALLPWGVPLNAKFLAGWCAIAPICGALEWRPHIWLTGRSGVGKSYTVKNIIEEITGKIALKSQGVVSEPGIRQTISNDSRPVIIDEAESEDEQSIARFKAVMGLARQASTEGGGAIIKGSSTGHAIQFNVRSCFCFASIGVAAVNRADTSRITVLSLSSLHASPAQFESLKSCYSAIMDNPDFGAMIRARSVANAITIRHNARIFSRVVSQKLGDQRTGDQLGALLAGAFSLTSTKEIEPAAASAWVTAQDWSGFTAEEADRDENLALARLLDHVVAVTPSRKSSIGDLITVAVNPISSTEDRLGSTDALALTGIRLTTDSVVVSNTHAEIARIFIHTAWQGKWKDQLSRISGSKTLNSFRFGAAKHRAVSLPIDMFASQGPVVGQSEF